MAILRGVYAFEMIGPAQCRLELLDRESSWKGSSYLESKFYHSTYHRSYEVHQDEFLVFEMVHISSQLSACALLCKPFLLALHLFLVVPLEIAHLLS